MAVAGLGWKERGSQGQTQPCCYLYLPLELVGLKSDEAGMNVAGAVALLVGQVERLLRAWAELPLCCA